MPRALKATNEQIVDAYLATGSVWAAAKRLGMVGQSVHERLVAIGYPLQSRRWTDEERQELRDLIANGVTAGDAARRLGRTFAAVTCRLNEMGVTGYKRPSPAKIPRGKGYDKLSMHRHLKALEQSDELATRYCRRVGLNINSFAYAAQKHHRERWEAICAQRAELPKKECLNCAAEFHPASGKQTYCTRLCSGRARADRNYFGGKRMTAIGMAEETCQLCGKQGHEGLTPHHIIGKENDPDNDMMIALCLGCHQIITLLGARNFVNEPAALQTMITLAWLRRNGAGELAGKELYVEVDIEFAEAEEA